MFNLMLFLHLVTAIFLVGPLVQIATTAARGLRENDASATAASARGAKIYANASILVVIFGFGLMSMDSPYHDGKVAEFSEPFIWASTVLALVAIGVVLGLLVPTLEKATAAIGASEAVGHLKGRVAASGGIVGLLFLVIVVLMVYKPGS